MKITKQQLRQMIKEEITKELDSDESLQELFGMFGGDKKEKSQPQAAPEPEPEKEKEDVKKGATFEQGDLTPEEFEKLKRHLSGLIRRGKRGEALRKEEERYRKQAAYRKTPEFKAGQKPLKFGPASKSEFGRGGRRIKKSAR